MLRETISEKGGCEKFRLPIPESRYLREFLLPRRLWKIFAGRHRSRHKKWEGVLSGGSLWTDFHAGYAWHW